MDLDRAQRSNVTDERFRTGDVVLTPDQERDFLCVPLACGRARTLPLLWLAAHGNFRDVQLLRLLADALVWGGFGGEDLTIPDRLDRPQGQLSSRLPPVSCAVMR